MIDPRPAETVSDRSDRSDRLDIVSLFRSDVLPPVSDRSDHKALQRTVRAPSGPTGPTDPKPCRTEKPSQNQCGPTGTTGPTRIAEGARLSTPSVADLDGFEERAAIAQHDGGLPRADAERAAAEALGLSRGPATDIAPSADPFARAIAAALADFEAMDDPLDPRAWA